MFDNEIAVIFDCHNVNLTGIIHQSESRLNTGVLIIVGGPQYRVGSHRQFVLLARSLANAGISVMRFDCRGMGDSDGNSRSFLDIDDDILAAIDIFYKTCPGLTRIVIWGLCDAASAALFYGYQDDRVKGLILLNPWVFTEHGAAKTYLKYYYLNRLLNPDFWKKIFSFKFDYAKSFKSLVTFLTKIFNQSNTGEKDNNISNDDKGLVSNSLSLPIRMKACFNRFNYPVLLILSGNDLTADEFRETVNSDQEWQVLLKEKKMTQFTLSEADHTFSSSSWRDQVAKWTLEWINKL